MYKNILKVTNRLIHHTKRPILSQISKNHPKRTKYVLKENSFERRILTYLQPTTKNIPEEQSINGTTKNQIRNLDFELRKRLMSMSTPEIFKFLYEFCKAVPELVTSLPFYDQSLTKLSYFIQQMNKDELVRLCYFSGLKKKSSTSQQIIKDCLDKLAEQPDILTTEDLVIICSATFKTSTKIRHKKLLSEIQNRLYDNVSILNDEAFFVTIVKSLRHNRNYDDELLATLCAVMFFNGTIRKYNFTALVHILALYADGTYYNEDFLEFVNTKSLKYFEQAKIGPATSYFDETVRIKDLCRFLWALSYLGYDYDSERIYDYILPILRYYVDSPEKHIEDLIGTCLALAFFGNYPTDILKHLLTNKNLHNDRRNKSFAARLNILLTCLELERLQFFKTLNINPTPSPIYDVNKQLQRRPCLVKLYDAIIKLKDVLDFSDVEYRCQIPHLNIVGICCYDQEKRLKVQVECVDDENCIKNMDCMPNGSMRLKLRLLRSYRKPILRINQSDITDLSTEMLRNYIKKKIKNLL